VDSPARQPSDVTEHASVSPHATGQNAGTSRVHLVPELPSDAELIAQLHDADEHVARHAFSALFAAYWMPLCEWAYYFTRDRGAAEELVADVLANVWHRREAWAPQGSIETYLFGAVRMQMRYETRASDTHAALSARFVLPGESPGMGTVAPNPDADAQHAELRERLDRAIALLAPRARAAVMYRFYDGLRYDEIAARLGTTEHAARHLVSRAFRTLRASVTVDR